MIHGISAGDPSFGDSQTTGTSNLDRDAFMRLLVAQLQNQDPLAPQANEDFIAQLAQFSSLEEMQGVNENLVGLAVLQQSNALMGQLTDSSVLIGKEVKYVDPSTNEPSFGAVTSVKIQDGLAILRIGGKDIPLANVTEVGGTQPDVDADGEAEDTTE
jgi:flagellar basal-body rod modification protein FlgD